MVVLTELSSLEEIEEGLAEPHPDVTLRRLDHLSQARRARRLLDANEEAEACWRTRNLGQVRAWAELATLLKKSRSRLNTLVRSIQRMDAASDELQVAGIYFWIRFHAVRDQPTLTLGHYKNQGISYAMAHLDATHELTIHCTEGVLSIAEELAHTASQAQRDSIEETLLALTALRTSNRSTVRRLDRLRDLALRLNQLLIPDDRVNAHALSPKDLELKLLASRCARSINALCVRVKSGEPDTLHIINRLCHEISDELAAPLELNHTRFSGDILLVKSMHDLEEARRITMPHHDDLQPPPFVVLLIGINKLAHADQMALAVADGARPAHWVLQGVGALTKAQLLAAQVVDLRARLRRLQDLDVIGLDYKVLDPQALCDVAAIVGDINKELSDEWGVPKRGADCKAVAVLLDRVDEAVGMAWAEDRRLGDFVETLLATIQIARLEPIDFHY